MAYIVKQIVRISLICTYLIVREKGGGEVVEEEVLIAEPHLLHEPRVVVRQMVTQCTHYL